MKAILVKEFGGPEVLKLEEVAAPRPGPGQVVVRIRAAGVNPVDTYIRTGTHARKPPLPYTPGLDGAGVVESVGAGVKGFEPGARVYLSGSLSGTYAEVALAEPSMLHPLPERVTFSQGGGVHVTYATAYRALFLAARAQPGETLLVHGASGGVGTAAVQLGRAAGLVVIGTGGTEQGRALVEAEGAHHVFDHREPGYMEKIARVTEGRGVDVILEMLANVNLARDLEALAQRGRVVVVGSRGTLELDPRAAMKREASIIGTTLMSATPAELKTVHAAIVAGLENGSLRPVVGTELPLASAARAHGQVMEAGAHGKIVLIP